MPFYHYEAYDINGNIVKDKGNFSSIKELYEFLKKNRLLLIKYRKSFLYSTLIFKGTIKRLVLAEILNNISLLIRGGIPLRQALEDIQKSHSDITVKWLLEDLCRSFDKGNLLSDSLRQHKRFFSEIIITLVVIGEETGSLDKTLDDASKHLERIDEIISGTRKALLYPSFVFFTMIGALCFWMIYVLPKMLELIFAMGLTKLPISTEILLKSVFIFKIIYPYIMVLVIFVFILYFITSKKEHLKYYWDIFFSKMPFIGNVIKFSQFAFFFEYSALLTHAGINIIKILDLMETSINYQILKTGLRRVKISVSSGVSLYESFSKINYFEPFILRMIYVGESSGNLTEQFSILADYYKRHVNNFVNTMSKVIEPVLLLFAGLIFIIIALGLLGPMYEVMTKIR